MAVLRRILLALWGIVLCAGAAVLAVALINPAFAARAVSYLDDCLLYNIEECFLRGQQPWLTLLVGIGLLVLGVFILYVAFYHRHTPKQVTVAALDGGEVMVSFSAIDNVVKKAAASVAGVSNIENKMQVDKSGLSISLGLALSSQVSAPDAGVRVRRAVDEYLSSSLGVTPLSIQVTVTRVLDGGSRPPKGQPSPESAAPTWSEIPVTPCPTASEIPVEAVAAAPAEITLAVPVAAVTETPDAAPIETPDAASSEAEEVPAVAEAFPEAAEASSETTEAAAELNAPDISAPQKPSKSPWARMKERKHGSK